MNDPRAWKRFWKNPSSFLGLAFCVAMGLSALVGPWVSPPEQDEKISSMRQFFVTHVGSAVPLHPSNEQFSDGLDTKVGAPLGPTAKFRFGTDTLGRDQLSRLLVGARTSLQVALFSASIAVMIGLFLGLLMGYFGGALDAVLMRVVDLFMSVPFLLIALVLNGVTDNASMTSLYVILGGLSWMTLARIVRTKTMQLRELEYVHASRAIGGNTFYILFRHILPGVLGPVIAIGTALVAQMIVAESAMSFLGFGVPPPNASLGSMLDDGQTMLTRDPRLVLQPGLLIMAAVFGFNLLGESLRDAFDPKD